MKHEPQRSRDADKRLRFPKVLLTGAAGFVGAHLIRELESHGHCVATTDALPPGAAAARALPGYRQCDLRDRNALRSLFHDAAPDACIHLGAISFVPDGDERPEDLLTINIAGTVNLADALRRERPGCRLLFISSSQIYGAVTDTRTANVPIRENAPPMPLSMYSISKVAAENAALAYGAAYGFDALIARPANHTGPGQSPRFVAVSFAKQMLAAARGELSEMRVGNLESIRDFTDVRDVARAYRLIIERGQAGLAYNITTNERVKIGELIMLLSGITGANPAVSVDPALYRPGDASLRLDVSRLREHTGWVPKRTLRQTLEDIVERLRAET